MIFLLKFVILIFNISIYVFNTSVAVFFPSNIFSFNKLLSLLFFRSWSCLLLSLDMMENYVGHDEPFVCFQDIIKLNGVIPIQTLFFSIFLPGFPFINASLRISLYCFSIGLFIEPHFPSGSLYGDDPQNFKSSSFQMERQKLSST